MSSPFESEIKNAIYAGFKGKLLTGSYRKATLSGVDSVGDHTITYPTYTCEGVVDTYSAYYRRVSGIPESDVSILIIAGSLSVTPGKQDQVKFRDQWYQVREVSKDPANATWTLQSYKIADPT